jgi:hypothetical protein
MLPLPRDIAAYDLDRKDTCSLPQGLEGIDLKTYQYPVQAWKCIASAPHFAGHDPPQSHPRDANANT